MTTSIYRHAESTANAGLATERYDTIPLSSLGHEQAVRLSEQIIVAPDLFVTSRFLRTQQTAAPTLAKFPNVPREIWPVEEFTYLAGSQCKGTTFDERAPLVKAYWEKLDPDYVDGQEVESFNQMTGRADGLIARIRQNPNRRVIVFSHGLFMKAVFLRLTRPELEGRAFMAAVRDSRQSMRIANTARMDLSLNEHGRLVPGFSPVAG